MNEFKVGDIVKHKASFLQATSWYTNVPQDGLVTAVRGESVLVQWCNREESIPIRYTNIILAGKPDMSGL